MYTLTYSIWGHALHAHVRAKNENSKILYTKYIINSLICIIISTVNNYSRKISLKITTFHNFISYLFLTDFNQIFTILFENV